MNTGVPRSDASPTDVDAGGVDPQSEPAVSSKPSDLTISIGDLPGPLVAAMEKLTSSPRTSPKIRVFFKEYLPALTPLAAVFISGIAFYYTRQFNLRTSAAASSETVRKLIADVGQGTDDRSRTIEAMNLAAYGEQALPAVEMVLGAEDDQLRRGGVLVAKQMYRSGTIAHQKLMEKMLTFYDEPTTRLGALEWLVEMKGQLATKDRELAFQKLKVSFGEKGEQCSHQEKHIAMETANLLMIWAMKDSRDLLDGMSRTCTNEDVRAQAKNALDAIK